MMFAQKFVCAVKVNGKILRESSNLVTLPFGAEYEILLKNLNSRRAMVSVSVDGVNATDGKLIIGANSSVTLQRFIRNGNLSSGNRFKFIERTSGIESHRGIKEDDGLIRAEFWQEKEKPQEITETIIRRYYDQLPWYDPYPVYPRPWLRIWNDGITYTSSSGLSGTVQDSEFSKYAGQASGSSSDEGPIGGGIMRAMNMAVNTAGITVPGSESNQQFHNVSGFPLESQSTVIVLQLRGEIGGVAVEVPVTVDRKPECVTCGKVNKAANKFCTDCGTALQLI
jgi:hypothetical protein